MEPAGTKETDNLPKEPSAALEKLMTTYGSSVLRTAYFYMADRYLAEDVSQEVFIRAYRNWSNFRRDSHVLTWLTKITINLCKDRLRVMSSSEQPTDPLLLRLTEQLNVEEQALQRWRDTTILKHVMNLPAPYHEVIYLYYYLDLTTSEIAEATESPEGTVRGRLHRARELLAQLLKMEELAHDPN